MLPFLLTLRQIARGVWRGLRDPEFQVLFSLAFLTVLSCTLFTPGSRRCVGRAHFTSASST